ncbi:MAG: copper resistance protein CopC [Gemmatimonadales bacterium]
MLKIGMLVALVASLTTSGPAVRHLTLVDSSPKKDAVLTTATTEIVLTFNEGLDPARRAISLRGPSGAVTMGPVRSVPDTLAFAASITGPMPAGVYTVSWLAGAPAHASIRGRYTFTVKPAP